MKWSRRSNFVDPILPLNIDASKVVELMQCFINPTLILESDVFTNHLFFTTNTKISRKEALCSPQACSLQTLGLFPLIRTIYLSLDFLILNPSK